MSGLRDWNVIQTTIQNQSKIYPNYFNSFPNQFQLDMQSNVKIYQTYLQKSLQNLSKIDPKTFPKSIQKSFKNRSKNLSNTDPPKILKNIEKP